MTSTTVDGILSSSSPKPLVETARSGSEVRDGGTGKSNFGSLPDSFPARFCTAASEARKSPSAHGDAVAFGLSPCSSLHCSQSCRLAYGTGPGVGLAVDLSNGPTEKEDDTEGMSSEEAREPKEGRERACDAQVCPVEDSRLSRGSGVGDGDSTEGAYEGRA